MEEIDFKQIETNFRRRVSHTTTHFHRYLDAQISWDARLIGIKGCRGVGKTTLLLQHIKESFDDLDKVLYVSLDDIWFENHTVPDLVEYCYLHGVRHLFLDEVHRLQHWQTVIKNIYDNYPEMKVVYTGSSMLELDAHEGDLSRRQLMYTMHGMSFREYLALSEDIALPAYSLTEVLENHKDIASDVTGRLQVIPAFERYLRQGCYPFFADDSELFGVRLNSTIRQVLEGDLLTIEEVSYATIRKVSKMLAILAQRVPQTPRMQELYAQLDTSREQGMKMLYLLDRAGLLALLSQEAKSFKRLVKPDKIYLGDSNLMYALTNQVDVGTLRETFFYHQMRQAHNVVLPAKGDFRVDDTYLFEVGGPSKDYSQIKDVPNSYLAVDGIEYGWGSRIPLWAFGFMY